MEFKIKKIKIFSSENKMGKEHELDYTSINIQGENKTGKTQFLELIDVMLGKDSTERIKLENMELHLVELDISINGIDARLSTKFNKSIISERKINQMSYAKGKEYKQGLTKLLFKEILENGEKKLGIRNMLIFNLFHETNVGPNAVLLSKLKENKYYAEIDDTFYFALGIGEQSIFKLKKELQNLKNAKTLIVNEMKEHERYQKKMNELNEIANLSPKKISEYGKVEKKIFESRVKLGEIDDLLNSIKNEKKIEHQEIFLDYLINIAEKPDIKQEIEELKLVIGKVRHDLQAKGYLSEFAPSAVLELKNQIIEDEQYLSNFAEPIKVRYFLEEKILQESDSKKRLSEIEIEIGKISSQIEKQQVHGKQAFVKIGKIMMTYLLLTQEYFKSESKTDKKEEPSILETDRIEFSGASYDPTLRGLKEDKEVAKSIGSHAFATIFQVCYILALHEYSNSNNGNIIPFIILDGFGQPMDTESVDCFVKIVNKFKKENPQIQIITLDHEPYRFHGSQVYNFTKNGNGLL